MQSKSTKGVQPSRRTTSTPPSSRQDISRLEARAPRFAHLERHGQGGSSATRGLVLGAATMVLLAAAAIGDLALKGTLTSRAATAPSGGLNYYVSTNGSDTNAGTQSAPFRTIDKASSVAQPGTVVHVAPGTYSSSGAISTSASGTPSAPIEFVSDARWAAKIVVAGTDRAWENDGDYVQIVGFDITNTYSQGRLGLVNYGSHARLIGNHVHNISESYCAAALGGSGIVNANYSATDDDVIGNVVDHIGPTSACNLVQGIYHSAYGGHIVNNIVDNVSAYGIQLWHAANAVAVSDNLVFSSSAGGIIIGAGDAPGGVTADNMVVTNNIVADNAGFGIREYGAVGTHNSYANNDVMGNSDGGFSLLNGNVATGTLTVDPHFVNWQGSGNGDYHLQVGSPAIGAGTSLGAASTDFDGNARPQQHGFDIGPYEYVVTGAAGTPTPQPAATGTTVPTATSIPASPTVMQSPAPLATPTATPAPPTSPTATATATTPQPSVSPSPSPTPSGSGGHGHGGTPHRRSAGNIVGDWLKALAHLFGQG